MVRRRALWLNSATEMQLTAGTAQHLDLGDAPRSQLGSTNLGGLTIARMIINATWQSDALAADFERCMTFVGLDKYLV